MKHRFIKVGLPLLLVVAFLAACLYTVEDPIQRSTYNVPVHVEQGGSKLVIESGGAVEVQSGGSIAVTPGATVNLGGVGSSYGNVVVSAPTAIGTATPAAYINSAGVSKILEVEDGGTVLMDVQNGGGVNVVAPTAVATSVPGLTVNGLGVSNPLEVRINATPVFAVRDAGTFQGVIKYGTAGQQLVCGTTVITDNANVSHGLTTPTFALCGLNAASTGDAHSCTAQVSGANATVRVYQTAATPTANSTGVSVNWCVIGTP